MIQSRAPERGLLSHSQSNCGCKRFRLWAAMGRQYKPAAVLTDCKAISSCTRVDGTPGTRAAAACWHARGPPAPAPAPRWRGDVVGCEEGSASQAVGARKEVPARPQSALRSSRRQRITLRCTQQPAAGTLTIPGLPTSAEIWASVLVLALRTMGVMRPPSVATATAMSTVAWGRIARC